MTRRSKEACYEEIMVYLNSRRRIHSNLEERIKVCYTSMVQRVKERLDCLKQDPNNAYIIEYEELWKKVVTSSIYDSQLYDLITAEKMRTARQKDSDFLFEFCDEISNHRNLNNHRGGSKNG